MAERRGGGVRRWYAGWTLWMVSASAAWAIPAFDEVRADFKPSDTLILSREGEVLQRLRTDATVRRGQWVPLAEVSPALRTALVLSEDKRFFEHSGVDWRAASAAAWGNLWNQRTRGASTITMQLAGLLDGDWRQGPGGRTVVQKLGQTVAAQVLDRRWRKDQILEAYLNLVPFRGEIVGIYGLMGAGRTELLECIFGCHAGRATGSVKVQHRELIGQNVTACISAGLALIPEDRKADGLVHTMSIAENLTLSSLRSES